MWYDLRLLHISLLISARSLAFSHHCTSSLIRSHNDPQFAYNWPLNKKRTRLIGRVKSHNEWQSRLPGSENNLTSDSVRKACRNDSDDVPQCCHGVLLMQYLAEKDILPTFLQQEILIMMINVITSAGDLLFCYFYPDTLFPVLLLLQVLRYWPQTNLISSVLCPNSVLLYSFWKDTLRFSLFFLSFEWSFGI